MSLRHKTLLIISLTLLSLLLGAVALSRLLVLSRATLSVEITLAALLLAAGILIGAITLWFLERNVFARLAHLSQAVTRIATSGDLSVRVSVVGQDELARVGSAINEMLATLQRSEALRRKSEERYRTLAEAAHDMIFIVGADDTIQYANSFAARQLGCQPHNLIGQSRAGLFPGDATQAQSLRTCLETGQPLYAETLSSFPERNLWLGTWLTPLTDEDGQLTAVLGIARDITERKQAEAARREAESKYHTFFENALEGIFQSLPSGRYLSVNPAMARMYGYDSPEDMIASVTDISRQIHVNPAQRDAFRTAIEEQGEVRGAVNENYRKDGSRIWTSTNARAVRDEHGGVVYYEGFTQDITERRRTEAALRESEDRYRDLVEHSQELICTHDLEGHVLSANRAAEQLLGYSRDEITHMNLRDFLAPEVKDQLDDYLAAIRQQGVASGLLLVRTRSGERRIWEYDNSLRTEGVATPIVRGLARDVTDRWRAEAALRESEERYRLLFRHAPVGVFQYDTRYRITDCNDRFVTILQSSRERLIGLDLMQLQDSSLTPTLNAALQGQEALYEGLYRATTSSAEIWGSVRTAPLRNKQGRVIGAVGIVEDLTERKRAEDALRESEERFSVFMKHLPAAAFIKDEAGRALYVNPYLQRLFDWQDWQSKLTSELLPDKIALLMTADDRRALAEGPLIVTESLTDAQGAPRTFETYKFPIRIEGQPTLLGGIAVDVTQRQRAETEILQRNVELGALNEIGQALTKLAEPGEILEMIRVTIGQVFDNTNFYIALYDDASQIVSFPIYTIGGQRREAHSRPFANGLTEYVIRTRAPLLLRSEAMQRLDELGVDRIGRPAESLMAAPMLAGDKVIGVISVQDYQKPNVYTPAQLDLLATFAAQAAIAFENAQLYQQVRRYALELENRVAARTAELDHERQRLRAILDAAGEGIVFATADGTIEYINPAMEQLTGYSIREVLGQNPRMWQSGRTPPAIYSQLWSTIKGSQVWKGELLNRRKDGTLYDTAVTIAPLNDVHGNLIGFVGIQRDITRQKDLERLKDQFVANVSHELRTPLANVKLYLSLLDRGKSDKHSQYMQTLQRETTRLENLIENLLNISQLDMGAIPIQLAPIDVNRLIADLFIDRESLAAKHGLSIKNQTDPSLPAAMGHATLLAQVMSNLMTNAINYSPPGSCITLVTRAQQDAGQTWVTFTIHDIGPGISAKDLPHVFERFYRGEVGRQSGLPGTGLGLAICKEIVGKLDGHITVESQADQGTAFTVWLKPADV